MLIARRYELHNEKVIKYFTSKYGDKVDDYLLVIDLSKDNPWQPILKFLQCRLDNYNDQDNRDGKEIERIENLVFPQSNQAPDAQTHDMIPKDMKFDWKNHEYPLFFESVFKQANRYYSKEYLMEYRYYQSFNDSNYVNLFENEYAKIIRRELMSQEMKRRQDREKN